MSTAGELQPDVTGLLRAWGQGCSEARDQLIPIVYRDLRRRAARLLRNERPGHTLQPTALVHEAFLRLVDSRMSFRDRAHFFAIAAEVMRRVLVDHARARQTQKRGRGKTPIALDETIALPIRRDEQLVELDDALSELVALDARQGRMVELRFFGGLSIEETAEVIGVSPATVKREWATARAWMYHRLKSVERPTA